MRSRLTIRLRVASAFALTTSLALVGLGAFVYYRVDTTLTEQVRSELTTRMDALATVAEPTRSETTAGMSGSSFGQILTIGGRLIASSPQLTGPLTDRPQSLLAGDQQVAIETTVQLADEDEREPAILLLRRVGDQVLVVGTSTEDLDDALAGVLTQMLIGGPLVLALASFAGYLVAGSALRPVENMRRRAASISARSSGERLPLPVAHDEVRELGQTLNAMLDRLDQGLVRQRRFVAEASHELRTPLALLKMELDLALSRSRSVEDLRAALRSANEEVNRLTRLAEDLLLLAAADERVAAEGTSELDVGQMLASLAERFATRAAHEGRSIEVTADSGLLVTGDRSRLDRAFSNLVDNALRHGAGRIGLAARGYDGHVTVRVTDQGSGLDDTLHDRAFDPFSGGAAARSQGGRGLGLAIVRAIVEEHRGAVEVDGGGSGAETTVTVVLPSSRRRQLVD